MNHTIPSNAIKVNKPFFNLISRLQGRYSFLKYLYTSVYTNKYYNFFTTFKLFIYKDASTLKMYRVILCCKVSFINSRERRKECLQRSTRGGKSE